jgi:23S rRNA pseudouridine1911/1915/1917 synthase
LARFRFRVSDDDAGRRLDAFLASQPQVQSRAAAARLLADGRVAVEGETADKAQRVRGGAVVDVELPEAEPLRAEHVPLAIAYEDADVLVVDKPAGLVVHPAGATTGATTLVNAVLALGASGGMAERPGLVHRLDKDTSGLVLVARSERAHARLQAALRRRAIERRYLALVDGAPRSRTGRIEAPIGRDRRDRARHSLDTATPRDAVTWFETVEPLGARTLLEVNLETGRTHQIRVHLEAIGLPVCGDPTYGTAGALGLERQFLHAHRLRFPHPRTGAQIDAASPLPGDLLAALERARSDGDRYD